MTDNITLRAPEMSDFDALFEAVQAHFIACIGFNLVAAEDIQDLWETHGFNRETDCRVAVTPDGQIVGYAEVVGFDPFVRLHTEIQTMPDYATAAIPVLRDWAIGRAIEITAGTPPEARAIVRAIILEQDQATRDALLAAGFEVVRYAQDMKIDLHDAMPAPVLPPGITIRPYNTETELRRLFEATREAFRDHYGHVETPEEEAFVRFQARTEGDDFDPSIWFVAVEGEEIAGMALCKLNTPDDPGMAWIDNVGVRRPWRRQGIALALLLHSFHELYRRGKTSVALGVDSQSLTGATALYEKAGMSLYLRFYQMEKEIKQGVEMATVALPE